MLQLSYGKGLAYISFLGTDMGLPPHVAPMSMPHDWRIRFLDVTSKVMPVPHSSGPERVATFQGRVRSTLAPASSTFLPFFPRTRQDFTRIGEDRKELEDAITICFYAVYVVFAGMFGNF